MLKLSRFLDSKYSVDNDEEQLEPLLPVTDRDTYLRYSSAFNTVLEKDVTCVAVTGPYGAGKTSLINAFIENYRHKLKFIRISLATFEGDDKRWMSTDKIEKSILQQLIYSAGQNKLEYSRFKKIQKPTWLRTKAALISIFAISTGTAIIYWENVEEFLFTASRWQEFLIAGVIGAFWILLLFSIVHGILKTSSGLSITKLSLRKAEIETENKSQESVFNKHLDEIIYFFQETPCDVVVIEDLDRFQKTEIFTKIREINQLINANPDVRPKIKKPIVFLFAIRDDLFKGKDRTKFFDLLIPVIPFVSAGNAYDVLHNKLVDAGLRKSLSDKFLRQVTVYVTDNRHLVNIVNEYSLYRKNLFLDTSLDPNKLFAIVLYKVFFPEDFGKLHMNEGVLAGLVKGLRARRKTKREELYNKLEEIHEAEQEAREGRINSREALASAYIGAIMRQHGQSMGGITDSNTGHQVRFSADTQSIFTILKQSKRLQVVDFNSRTTKHLNLAELEDSIHPGLSLDERLRVIDRNVELAEAGIAKTRTALETELRDIRYLPLNLAFSAAEIREKVSTFDNGDLFVYLVTEGLLGEDYDYYTSHFHKGATTRADRDYVQRFNKGDEIDFDEKIDTPSEILLILDDGLFGKPQGFNLTLVDHVLTKEDFFHPALISGFKSFPKEAFRFLQFYYSEGKHVEKLLRMLVENWSDFLDAAASCQNPLPHVKKIIEKAEDKTISALRKPSKFIEQIERSAPDIFDSQILVGRLPLLADSGALIDDIEFPNVSLDVRAEAIRAVTEHSLWEISPKNVATILAWQDIEIQKAQSEMFVSLEKAPKSVFNYIEENINSFIENCFLEVDTTVAEPCEGVEKILSIQGLDEELGKKIVAWQETRLRFSEVPSNYWNTVIEKQKYVVSWPNIEHLLMETGDFAKLLPIFTSADIVSELAKQRKAIPLDLFEFLVDLDSMDLESYKKLISSDLGDISELPTAIDHNKKLHLIRSGMIELNESGWNWLDGNPSLRVALIEEEFTSYEEIKNWTFDDAELAGLLKSKIPPAAKRKLLLKAGTIECGEDINLLNEVVNILASPDTTISDFDENFVESIIGAALPENAILLLTRMIPVWDEVRVMRNFQAIGPPYEKIADYGQMPAIPENEDNAALAEALQERDFISKFKEEERGIRIITKRNKPSLE